MVVTTKKKERTSRLLLGAATVFASLAPCAVGVFTTYVTSGYFYLALYFCFVLVLVALYLLAPKRTAAPLQNLLIALISLCITITLVDLIMRPTLGSILYYRPNEMFIHRWPVMPLVSRYEPNASYEGDTFGDLAATSGVRDFREYRHIVFKVDSFGFRNEKTSERLNFDVLVLGDSFGVGNGTTQEKTWAGLLASRYGLATYNLSTPGSPWTEFINLAVESRRLRTHEGTTVIWAIFAGNDLDEAYGPTLDVTQLPWNDRLHALRVSFQTFRDRSPIHQLYSRFALSRSSRVVVREFPDGRTILFSKRYVQARGRSYEEVLAHPNYKNLEMTVDAMSKFAEEQGLTVKVVLIPSKVEVYSWVEDGASPWSTPSTPSGFSVALEKIARENGLEFLDLKPFLVGEAKEVYESSGELLWWYDDTHWNVRGHDVVASIIYDELLAPGKKSR
jgi:hypothetical protein